MKSKSILANVCVSRIHLHNPKTWVLHRTVTYLRRKMIKALQKPKNFRGRLRAADIFAKDVAFAQVTENKTATAKLFIGLPVRQLGEKTGGRRFSVDQKLLSLSAYYRNPKAYKLLSKVFDLPDTTTLLNLLHELPLSAGINEQLFSLLKKKVFQIPTKERYCTLIFDEMNLRPHLQYDERKDRIEGFEDFGNCRRSPYIADRVLVFMINGVHREFKQPVAYTFCAGSVEASELAFHLRTIIKAVISTGLKVIATVCNPRKSNEKAIVQLVQETEQAYAIKIKKWMKQDYFFDIDEEKIIPLFDAPHLLKEIRDNMISKNISYEIDGIRYVGKWEHILQTYHADLKLCPNLRLLPKLTDLHFSSDSLSKRNCEYAIQILSYRMAAIMSYYADHTNILKEGNNTYRIIVFFDSLFDSVNGNSAVGKDNKRLLDALTRKSSHMAFWSDSISTLKSIDFICENGERIKPPCLENWIRTIHGFRALSEYLNRFDLPSLHLRRFNQEALDIFFNSINYRGVQNVMPTCAGFEFAYKTLLIDNLVSPHTVKDYNDDECSSQCLLSLKTIICDTEDIVPAGDARKIPGNKLLIQRSATSENVNSFRVGGSNYVAGRILKKLQKRVFKNCHNCNTFSFCKSDSDTLVARECADKTWLSYPSPNFVIAVKSINRIIDRHLITQCHVENFKKKIHADLMQNIDFTFIDCDRHRIDFIYYLCTFSIRIIVNGWCRDVCRILRGKNRRDIDGDPVKSAARIRYSKYYNYQKRK